MNKLLLIIISLITLLPAQAGALTVEDRKAVLYGSEFYSTVDNTLSCSTTGSDSTGTIEGRDNVEKAYNYFVAKNLQPFQAAGIVGNLMQESGVDPTAIQPGGPGRGIAQWSVGGRWDVLISYAKSLQNTPPTDLILQLDFMWKELTGTYGSALAALKQTQTVDEATQVFEEKYKAAGNPQMANRIRYAKQVLQKFGGGANVAIVTGPSSCAGSSGGLGSDRDFTFPEKTTQAAIKSQTPHWCYDQPTFCFHHDYFAQDIFNAEGTPVVSAVQGTVVSATDESCSGAQDLKVPRVQIRGTDGRYYYYTHMRPGSIQVHAGQSVVGGTPLGVIGPRDCAENTNPHLHFQVSSVLITNTSDPVEQTKYIQPQELLYASFNNLPEN